MVNFWQKLPRPFFVLAPLDDVTDVAFRTLIARHSSPSIPRVLFTEFTSADGLIRADERGQQKLRTKLAYDAAQHPIVAQLFTSVPKHMERCAALIRELGFDGFDINMGCPDRAVERQHCGSALIREPALARELIAAAKQGARHGESGGIPVSVKTRLGYNEDELETWLPNLLAAEPAVIALHARTRKEMSKVPARWERIKRAVEIRTEFGSHALIVGNGDVGGLDDARQKARGSGVDGVMLGRAIFGNPWLFNERSDAPSPAERMRALDEHIALFEEHLAGVTSPAVMKRHFKAYISGWDNAGELRQALMDAPTLAEARAILSGALNDAELRDTVAAVSN